MSDDHRPVLYVISQYVDGPSVPKCYFLQNEGIVASLDDVQPLLAARYPGGEVRRSNCEHPHWTMFLQGEETDFVFMVEEFPAPQIPSDGCRLSVSEALLDIARGDAFKEMRFADDDDTEYHMRRERRAMSIARAALTRAGIPL